MLAKGDFRFTTGGVVMAEVFEDVRVPTVKFSTNSKASLFLIQKDAFLLWKYHDVRIGYTQLEWAMRLSFVR